MYVRSQRPPGGFRRPQKWPGGSGAKKSHPYKKEIKRNRPVLERVKNLSFWPSISSCLATSLDSQNGYKQTHERTNKQTQKQQTNKQTNCKSTSKQPTNQQTNQPTNKPTNVCVCFSAFAGGSFGLSADVLIFRTSCCKSFLGSCSFLFFAHRAVIQFRATCLCDMFP